MSKQFHPVSLHVIRGALEYVGFEVGKIRTLAAGSPIQPISTYDVQITAVKDLNLLDIPPRVVLAAANGAFARDVTCTYVQFNGENWSLRIVASAVQEENRSLTIAEDGQVVAVEDRSNKLPWED